MKCAWLLLIIILIQCDIIQLEFMHNSIYEYNTDQFHKSDNLVTAITRICHDILNNSRSSDFWRTLYYGYYHDTEATLKKTLCLKWENILGSSPDRYKIALLFNKLLEFQEQTKILVDELALFRKYNLQCPDSLNNNNLDQFVNIIKRNLQAFFFEILDDVILENSHPTDKVNGEIRPNDSSEEEATETFRKDKFQGQIIIGGNTVFELPREFLSVAFGSKLIQDRFQLIPHRRNRFIKLASYLSPSMLRVGGSGANFLMYDPSRTSNALGSSGSEPWHEREVCEKQLHDDFTNFTMSGSQWDFLTGLVQELNWTMLFDLNQFTRNGRKWDNANAKLILNDIATQETKIIWQLGNEPNAYAHKFGWFISPSRAAKDYKQLRRILKQRSATLLVGPDVTRPRNVNQSDDYGEDSMQFLIEFLKKAGHVIDIVSWHHFYMNGRTSTAEDFMSLEMFEIFPKQIAQLVAVRDLYAPDKQIWLTETAIAYGGGAPDLSETFVATFLWLDKLGSAAIGGISVLMRQSLFGGCYGIIDRNLDPTPNYWISVLHKQLVGRRVLVVHRLGVSRNVRLYAHCLRTDHFLYKAGKIVIFGLNIGNQSETVQIDDNKSNGIYQYMLTAPDNDVTSRHILLNGELLTTYHNGTLRPLKPKLIQDLTLAGQSVNFFIVQLDYHELC